MTVHHLSTLALHRAVAGEQLSTDVSEHLESCGACRQRVADTRALCAEFANEPELPGRLNALVGAVRAPVVADVSPIATHRRARQPLAWASGVMACAASVGLMLGIRGTVGSGRDETAEMNTRTKGGARDGLEVIRRDARGNVETLVGSARVRPGEAIRFAVTLERPGHIAVLGIDAAQAVTVYAPSGPMLMELTAGARRVLDGSIVLDDVLGPEQIVLVVCETPRPVEEVVLEARVAITRASGNPLALGNVSSCRQLALTVEKVR